MILNQVSNGQKVNEGVLDFSERPTEIVLPFVRCSKAIVIARYSQNIGIRYPRFIVFDHDLTNGENRCLAYLDDGSVTSIDVTIDAENIHIPFTSGWYWEYSVKWYTF